MPLTFEVPVSRDELATFAAAGQTELAFEGEDQAVLVYRFPSYDEEWPLVDGERPEGAPPSAAEHHARYEAEVRALIDSARARAGGEQDADAGDDVTRLEV